MKADVAIVGAGPVGLFAVFQCGMLGLSCRIIDILGQPGGQCAALYPEKPIYDVPGFGSIEARRLVDRLYAQAMAFHPPFHLGVQVKSLVSHPDGRFDVRLSDGSTLDAGAVIVAAGAGSFAPNRPDLPGIEAYEGRSVFYSIARREDLAGKRVVIAGGGDTAVDWANLLKDVCASVELVHRRARLRAAPESLRRLDEAIRSGKVSPVVPFQLSGLRGDPNAGKLENVVVTSLDGEERILDADVLLPFFGLATELGPIARWGLSLARSQIVVDQATCATSVEGIYAVGDVAAYPHKLKLILTGFAEAAQAAHAIRARLRPDEAHRFEHSTTKGVPGAQSSTGGSLPALHEVVP